MRFFVLALSFLICGCGGGSEFELVPVSGIITMDGKPLEGAEVVFAPQAVEDQASVGPASVGTTDASGKYVLVTTKGEEGAMVTDHVVAVSLNKISDSAISAKADQAFKDNPDITADELRDVKDAARRAMITQTPIPAIYNQKSILKMKVEEATENANFDLKSDGS